MDTVWSDLRYGIRMFFKSPGFTAVAVIILAIGIGASTAIFSVVNGLLLQPLPFQEPDRLVLMWETYKRTQEKSVSYLNFTDWRAQNRAFEDMGAYSSWTFTITGDEPERLSGAVVTENLFSVLGVRPRLGRTFLPEEDRPGGADVAVISDGLWRRRFGGEPGVIGQTLTMNGRSTTIIGVMPPEFQFPRTAIELWMPLTPAIESDLPQRGNHPGLYVVGRLKPAVSLDRARLDMTMIARRLAEQYPETNADQSVLLLPLHDYYVKDFQTVFILLMEAVAFVLFIACANVANLLIARAATREKEMAIRMALGAGRGRLLRQLLTESVLLSAVAACVGLMLALWGSDLIRSLVPTIADVPGLRRFNVDGTVLAFAMGLGVVTGLLFGLAPALTMTGRGLQDSLKQGERTSGIPGRRYMGQALIVSEIAISLVLLVGAGLMVRSVQRLLATDSGFDPRGVLTFQISPSGTNYEDDAARGRFFQQLLARLAAIPGVQSVGGVLPLPLSGSNRQINIRFADSPVAHPEETIRTDYAWTTPDYFRTMRIPLIRGRFFSEQDVADAPLVVLIDETMARQFFPDEDPIGKRLLAYGQTREIVGVVGHVKHYGVNAPSRVQLYAPHLQAPPFGMVLTLRLDRSPASVISAIRDRVREVDPHQPLYNIQTMEQLMNQSVANERVVMLLLSVFALVALILAAIGIYGILSHSVSQRTREIGVRVALGAQPLDIFKMVIRHGMRLTGVGLAVGVAAAFGLTRFLTGLLYHVNATDPMTFGTITVILAGVAFVACYLPARRATKVDPMVALRYE